MTNNNPIDQTSDPLAGIFNQKTIPSEPFKDKDGTRFPQGGCKFMRSAMMGRCHLFHSGSSNKGIVRYETMMNRCSYPVWLFCWLMVLVCHSAAGQEKHNMNEHGVYLFTSFRGNGEDGLHLAYSRDGYHWTALNEDRSFLKPEVGTKLMRDPCLRKGPDGKFHMVWTTGWGDKGFGYTSSTDLIHWEPQKYIPAIEHLEGAVNTWAPELFYDGATHEWLIIWATTVKGKYPDQTLDDGGLNHRQYYMTTADFDKFSETQLFYDPGFNCIDGTVICDGSSYRFIFKDERLGMKRLRWATADKAVGPYQAASEPFTGDWIEGPSAIKMGAEWFVFFDHYAVPQYYGAVKSTNLKDWEEVSEQMTFPKDFRHGTVLEIDGEILSRLKP
jgi:hypothetical protein